MLTATQIADLIDIVVDSATRGAEWTDIDIQKYSNLNRALWDLARERNIKEEVDVILQERCVRKVIEELEKIS